MPANYLVAGMARSYSSHGSQLIRARIKLAVRANKFAPTRCVSVVKLLGVRQCPRHHPRAYLARTGAAQGQRQFVQ